MLLYDRDIPCRVIRSDLMRIMIIVMTTPGRGPGMGSISRISLFHLQYLLDIYSTISLGRGGKMVHIGLCLLLIFRFNVTTSGLVAESADVSPDLLCLASTRERRYHLTRHYTPLHWAGLGSRWKSSSYKTQSITYSAQAVRSSSQVINIYFKRVACTVYWQ